VVSGFEGVRFDKLPERVREEVREALAKGGKPIGRRVCPRCGLPFRSLAKLETGGNTYYYAVHDVRFEGKSITWPCYLGPRSYVYVSKLHENEGLTLRGAVEPERFTEYVKEVVATKVSIATNNQEARPRIVKELLEARRVISVGLARLGVEVENNIEPEPPKATVKITKVAGKPAVEIALDDGSPGLIMSISTFKQLCEARALNPLLCAQLPPETQP
jgi:hypothetical protein